MKKRSRFRELHDTKFIIPNPGDAGSARLLASLGFEALATTSGGHTASLGRLDGEVTRDEAIEHARMISNATPLPVSADLENGFGDTPSAVEKTVAQASAAGLSGCSIEDYIKTLVDSVDRPANVLIMPGGPNVADLFEAGATRISVGSALNLTANAAVVEAARELLDEGSHTFWSRALASAGAIHKAFSSKD